MACSRDCSTSLLHPIEAALEDFGQSRVCGISPFILRFPMESWATESGLRNS